MAASITALVDGLALIANANQEQNQRRREGQREGHKADLNVAYRGLCNNDTGTSSLLYGDDLSTRIKEINEMNRVASKLTAGPSFAQRPSTQSHFGQRQHPYSTRGNELDGVLPWSFSRARLPPQLSWKAVPKKGQHARPTATDRPVNAAGTRKQRNPVNAAGTRKQRDPVNAAGTRKTCCKQGNASPAYRKGYMPRG